MTGTRRPSVGRSAMTLQDAGCHSTGPSGFESGMSCVSDATSGALKMDGVLSQDAMRVIQALQQRLRRAKMQLRLTEAEAGRAIAAAEERNVQCSSLNDRHQQVARIVAQLQQERDQELARQHELQRHLQAIREEIAAKKAATPIIVRLEDQEALAAQLAALLQQMEDAEKEDRGWRRQIAEAEAAQRRRVRARLKRDRLEAERREVEATAVVLERQNEARRVSDLAVAEQRGRFSAQQMARVAQLRSQKDLVEIELRRSSSHNAELERQMEVLRSRNKQLEAQEKRIRQDTEQQEQTLRAELRAQAHHIKVLTDLMRETETEREDDSFEAGKLLGGKVDCSRASGLDAVLLDDASDGDVEEWSWASLSPRAGRPAAEVGTAQAAATGTTSSQPPPSVHFVGDVGAFGGAAAPTISLCESFEKQESHEAAVREHLRNSTVAKPTAVRGNPVDAGNLAAASRNRDSGAVDEAVAAET